MTNTGGSIDTSLSVCVCVCVCVFVCVFVCLFEKALAQRNRIVNITSRCFIQWCNYSKVVFMFHSCECANGCERKCVCVCVCACLCVCVWVRVSVICVNLYASI